ncbi:transaldolase [Vibrio rotiferianus]|nr:transaldolase [Vibrio rotiferianus]NOH68139.1 transaldolase [Vibrio rotiferianus]TMX42885.1 transaldolase [Vibrio rotiferianus]TMX59342.1 transaldolase [Vibrio rotiferianus]TMX67694.1 transaldolase [Vibrio rotiferianus]
MGLSVVLITTTCAFASVSANRLIIINETSSQPTTENFGTEHLL